MSPKPNSLSLQSQEQHKVGSCFQRGFAGLSSGRATAQGVNSNTNALNAVLITPFPVATKTRNERDSALSQNQGCQTTTSPATPVPTPVKLNRLAIYLTGYEDKIRKHLIDVFNFGFRLHFQGPYKASCAKI